MNLLITGAWDNADQYMDEIKQQGYTVAFLQYENEMIPCDYDWVEAVICNGLFQSHPIDKFRNLKYIQLTSAGFDRISAAYVREKGIEIYNAKGVYSIPMAEYAVGGVLQIYKQTAFFYNNQKSHKWLKHRGLLELYEKRVCIVGCGSVGTECAKRFRAFGCEVTGVDIFLREDKDYDKIVGMEQMEAILPETDILILTLPLTGETKYFMNRRKFALMKEGAVLVNISRGAVVETESMISAMDRLGGAVLDVFEQEPLDSSNPLWNMERVIITPHNSFVGCNNGRRLSTLIMENLKERRKRK